jgi:hypothetical protein
METKFVGYLRDGHGVREILLVAQDEERSVSEFILSQNFLELQGGFVDSLAIVGIDDEDNAFSVVVIVSPQRPNLILASYVPNGKTETR